MAMNRFVKIALAAGSALAALPLAARTLGRRYFGERIASEVRLMLAAGIENDDTAVSDADLQRLPAPVQRYLRFAGVVGFPRIRTAYTRQTGTLLIDPDRESAPFQADEFFAVFPAGYLWHARIDATGWYGIDARDGYFAGHAETTAKVESVYTVLNETGPEVSKRGLVRFLSSMVFFPTALVGEVRWEALDESSARVFFEDDGVEVSAVCTFAPHGPLVSFLAERLRRVDDRYEQTRWSVFFDKYDACHGLRVPREASVHWHVDDELVEYAQVHFEDICFNIEPVID